MLSLDDEDDASDDAFTEDEEDDMRDLDGEDEDDEIERAEDDTNV